MRTSLSLLALSLVMSPAAAYAQAPGTLVGSPKQVEQHYESKTSVNGNQVQVWKRPVQTFNATYSNTVTQTQAVTQNVTQYSPNPNPYAYPGVPRAGTTYPDSMHRVVTTLSSSYNTSLHATVVTATTTRYVKQVFVVGNLEWAGTGSDAKTVGMYLNALYDGTFNYSGGLTLRNDDSRGNVTNVGSGAKSLLANILNSGNRSLLNSVPPNGTAYIISEDGEYVGSISGSSAANALGMGDFMSRSDSSGYRIMATTGGSMWGYPVLATQLVSPIALDLDHNGKISVTGKATGFKRFDPKLGFTPEGSVRFDLRGNGKVGRFEWLAGAGDGFLVDDSQGRISKALKADGAIDGNDLFGGQRYDNGYVKLAHLFGTKMLQFASASKDLHLSPRMAKGFVPLKGKALEGLKVWVDANHDGLVQDGELKTLKKLGITELGADYQVVTSDKEARMVSYYVQDGRKYMTEDVWFAEDPADFKE